MGLLNGRLPDPAGAGPSTTIGDLSISVGAALQGLDGETLDDLMQVADYALYEAKRAGRNRVRLGGDAGTPDGDRSRAD